METPFRCYICDIETNKRAQESVFNIKSQHSKKPIAELLKKFQNGVETIRARDGSNTCVLCEKCIDSINTYDEACQLAERVENQLKALIARTEERYKNCENDPISMPESGTTSANPEPAEFALEPDIASSFEMDYSYDFEDENNADEVATSEPEEEIVSEQEEVDSDDSFAWPKAGALKRKHGNQKEKTKGNVKKKPRIYNCIDCPADFYDKYDMQIHTASHKCPQYRCGICNMRIANGREAMEHEYLHAYCPDLQCIFCKQYFEKASILAHHMQTHNGDIKTICYICGKMVSTNAIDTVHIKSHLGIRDFECATCSKKFVDKMHLQRHLIIHTEERPFKCPDPDCGKRFNSLHNMKEHSFIHTPDKRPSYCRDCSICGKTFRRAGLLAQHYKREHNSIASTSKQFD